MDHESLSKFGLCEMWFVLGLCDSLHQAIRALIYIHLPTEVNSTNPDHAKGLQLLDLMTLPTLS